MRAPVFMWRERLVHAFQFKNRYLLLDVESGALHELDEASYKVVRAIEDKQDPYQAGIEQADVKEILQELDALRAAGEYDSPALNPPENAAPEVIKAMCLHIAHDCNLRCRYCFAGTGEFHGERKLMPVAVGKQALDFLIQKSGSRKNLEVDLFGGEPLINFEAVKEIVAYGRELEQKNGKTIRFTMTTNCVALDEEKMQWLNAEMYNIVLSLDGRREIHDALRPTVNGKGSYDIIIEKAKRMVELRGERQHYIRGTFTNRNLDFTEDVKSLVNEGFEQISLEPVVLPETDSYAILEADVTRILSEYDKLVDYMAESKKAGKWFNFFHFMIDLGNGPCLKKRISGCGAGVEYVAVTPDGDIYPCHQFVGEPGFCMGNVMTGTFLPEKQTQFRNCNVRTKEACKDCWAKYFCSGGCAANAYKYCGDINKPYAITCAFEKKRTECAIGINTQDA